MREHSTVRGMPRDMRDALRDFHRSGFDLHWLDPVTVGDRSTGKKPAITGHNAKPQPFTFKQLVASYRPGYGLGACCGVHNQLVVFDADGDVPKDVLAKFVRQARPQAITGSGGAHYYQAWPQGYTVPDTGVLWRGEGEHQELRLLGRGANVVLPPTLHWSGKKYALNMKPMRNGGPLVQPIHVWLVEEPQVEAILEALAPKRPPKSARVKALYNDRLDDAAKLLARIPNDGAGLTWDGFKSVMLALMNAFGDDEARELLHAWAAQCDRYDERRTDEQWQSWNKGRAERRYGVGTLIWMANGGWRSFT